MSREQRHGVKDVPAMGNVGEARSGVDGKAGTGHT